MCPPRNHSPHLGKLALKSRLILPILGALLGACSSTNDAQLPVKLPDGAPATAQRELLFPAQIAVITHLGASDPLPATLKLGREVEGTTAVLLRFEPTWREDAEITSAFIVVDGPPDARPSSRPIRIDVARILEPWSFETRWSTLPKTTVPAQGALLPRGAAPRLVVDVTPLVRAWSRHRADDHGIALLVEPQDPYGATLHLGTTSGQGPRLEVYVK